LEWLSDPEIWTALLTLTALEIVLGVDNIVFISILAGKLPVEQRKRARFIGLGLAMGGRLALLATISIIIKLEDPLLTIAGEELSGRDFILLGGGLFLLAKSTHEMFERLEVDTAEDGAPKRRLSFSFAVVQIVLLDIVFSLDSVITAVGMAQHLIIMSTAVVIAVFIMLLFAGAIGRFVNKHPSMRILALSFLLLIGALLVAEGMGQHIHKGYVYFAMAFSLSVELVNMKLRTRQQAPVELHNRYEDPVK
jgi:predicted tellurium resistance membrane protein TerC